MHSIPALIRFRRAIPSRYIAYTFSTVLILLAFLPGLRAKDAETPVPEQEVELPAVSVKSTKVTPVVPTLMFRDRKGAEGFRGQLWLLVHPWASKRVKIDAYYYKGIEEDVQILAIDGIELSTVPDGEKRQLMNKGTEGYGPSLFVVRNRANETYSVDLIKRGRLESSK